MGKSGIENNVLLIQNIKNMKSRIWSIAKKVLIICLIVIALTPWLLVIRNLMMGYGILMNEKELFDFVYVSEAFPLKVNDNLMVFWPRYNKYYPLKLSIDISTDKAKKIKDILDNMVKKPGFSYITILGNEAGVVVAWRVDETYINLNDYLELRLRELEIESSRDAPVK